MMIVVVGMFFKVVDCFFSTYIRIVLYVHICSGSELFITVWCVGKLWQLSTIMTDMRAAGQRALILSQTSHMLDLLESFMDHQHVRYLRLDSHHSV